LTLFFFVVVSKQQVIYHFLLVSRVDKRLFWKPIKIINMLQVTIAQKWDPNQVGSAGRAERMIYKQYNFPNTYENNEHFETIDHDHMLISDKKHAEECIKLYQIGTDNMLHDFFEKSHDKKILEFIIAFTKADTKIVWTGFRLLVTIHQGNGSKVWAMQLFAKDPKSNTVVYNGRVAPNVEK
jgi:hypothetical protein